MENKLILKRIKRHTLVFACILLGIETVLHLAGGVCDAILELIEFPIFVSGIKVREVESHQLAAIPANAIIYSVTDHFKTSQEGSNQNRPLRGG
jgi:hypothetical protein